MFDDQYQESIYGQARAAMQQIAASKALAESLGAFRRQLLEQGFSTESAEQIVEDMNRATSLFAANQAEG